MFGIGLPEMILIMALALIVVGPDKLPEMARSIAKGVMELKKTVNSLKENFAEDNPFDSVRPEIEEAAGSLKQQLGDSSPDGWTGLLEDNTMPEPDPEQAEAESAGAEEFKRDETVLDVTGDATTDDHVAAARDSNDSAPPPSDSQADDAEHDERGDDEVQTPSPGA